MKIIDMRSPYGSSVRLAGTDSESKSLLLSQEESIDDLIARLQEQIDSINENEDYDDKTKARKTEALQVKIDELSEIKAMREAEALKKQEKSVGNNNSNKDDSNDDGDEFISEEESKFMIESQLSYDKISNYSVVRKKLEAEKINSDDEADKFDKAISQLKYAEYMEVGKINASLKETKNTQNEKIKTSFYMPMEDDKDNSKEKAIQEEENNEDGN